MSHRPLKYNLALSELLTLLNNMLSAPTWIYTITSRLDSHLNVFFFPNPNAMS